MRGAFAAYFADKASMGRFERAHNNIFSVSQKKPRLEFIQPRFTDRQGRTTESITWMIPLLAMMSVVVTRASSIMTLPS